MDKLERALELAKGIIDYVSITSYEREVLSGEIKEFDEIYADFKNNELLKNNKNEIK